MSSCFYPARPPVSLLFQMRRLLHAVQPHDDKRVIELRPHQQDHADDIQPQHQYDNRRQRAVQHRIPRHIVHIERKAPRHEHPCHQRKQRPRPDLAEPEMQVRDDAVEQHEEREYDGGIDKYKAKKGKWRRLKDRCRDRQRLRQQTQQHASGDGKHKAAHDGQQKAGRHRERQQNIEHRAAVYLDAVDAVYRAHDRTHCPRQKIQRQQRPDEQRTERWRRRDLLKVRQDELLQAFRHQLEHRPKILDRNAEPRDERIDKHQKREQGKQQKIRKLCRRLRNAVIKKAVNHALDQI